MAQEKREGKRMAKAASDFPSAARRARDAGDRNELFTLTRKKMARIGSIFKISGKVGNTIFMERNGKCFARSKPAEVRNPNTPEQQAVRGRFRTAVKFYQRLNATSLHEVWKQAGDRARMSGFNLFMKTNLKMFDDKGQIADFDGLRLAAGNRPGAWGLTAMADGAGRVRLRWELDDGRVVVNGDDRLVVALLYGDRLFSPVVAKGAPALRREKTAVVEVERRPGAELHLYCFFVSPGGDAFSDSQHVAVWTEDGDR